MIMRETFKNLLGFRAIVGFVCLFYCFSGLLQSSEKSEAFFSCPSPDMISGRIFLDTFYTGNNAGAAIADIKVYLLGRTDPNGTEDIILDSANADDTGRFEFNDLIEGERYLLRFNNMPKGYALTGQSGQGPSRSNTMYVIAPNCDINFGLSSPKENVSPNARVALPIAQPGAAVNSGNISKFPGLLSIPFSPTYQGIQNDNRTQVSFKDVGTCWGLDYQCSKGRVYTSAYLKRHSGLGPFAAPALNSGEQDVPVDGIYMVEYMPTETYIGGFTLQGVNGIDLGTVTRGVIDFAVPASTDDTPCPYPNSLSAHDPDNLFKDSYDLDAFDKVGRVGMGSLSMGPDDAHLWVVNLYQNSIIQVDVSSDSHLPTDGSKIDGEYVKNFPIDFSALPDCNGEYHPWAVEFNGSYGYLGVVCDGSADGNNSDLSAHILRFIPENMNVLANEFELVLSFDLDYTRENKLDYKQQWNTWVSDWPAVVNNAAGESYYAQPMLSDIEFTSDDRMVISLMDRFGHQTGLENFDALIEDQTADFVCNAAGDVLLACPIDNGLYQIEGLSGCEHNNDDGSASHGRLALDDDGPSGTGEFFYADYVPQYSSSSSPHMEVTIGASAIHPHHEKVLHTVYDPIVADYSQGVQQYDVMDGSLTIPYQISSPDVSKANGMGDMALISSEAPMEVGNYVWIDANKNGIQETFEVPVSGIDISIADMDGKVLATVTTDNNGEYYINDDTPGFDGLEPFTMYHLVAGIDQYDTIEQVLLGQYEITISNEQYFLDSDHFDSDFDLYPNAPTQFLKYPSIKFTTGTIGSVDHSFDLGIVPVEIPCVENLSIAPENNQTTFCFEEDVQLMVNHSSNTDFIEVVYSSNAGLAAQELYFGDRAVLDINVLKEKIETNGTETSVTVDLPDGTSYIYVMLHPDSEFIDDPDCLPFGNTIVFVDAEMSSELDDLQACEGSNVVFQVEVQGGTEPYSYLWNTGSTIDQIILTNVINSQWYHVTVTDVYGCEVLDSAFLNVNNRLDVGLEEAEACENSEVTITPEIQGGTAPFSYSWSTGSNQESITVLVTNTQVYSVTITDINGCEGEATTTVTKLNNLNVVSSSDELCENELGIINVSIAGSSGPFSYQWTPSWINQDGSFTADESFDYSVIVTDNITGCQGMATGTVDVHPMVDIDNVLDEESCEYYVLPAITGTNLTNQVAYWTGSMATGQRYDVGDTVFSDLRLYIYDPSATLSRCNEQESFFVTITDETPNVDLSNGNVCAGDSPLTVDEENILDLRTLIVAGSTTGTWSTDSMHWIENNRILRVPSGVELTQIALDYMVSGNSGLGGNCGDKTFSTLVNIDQCYAKLGDRVWLDANADGIQDPGEEGISGVKVTLAGVASTGENIMLMSSTDSEGYYLFCDLPEGNYKITFTEVPGYHLTMDNVESNGDDKDSDADPVMLMTPTYELNPGDSLLTIDAGFFPLSKIGDFVWHDENANGIQDPEEEGLEGCKVMLNGTDIFGNEVIAMTDTDDNGQYMFCDLIPGEYKVTFPGKQDYELSPYQSGQADEASDSDANPENGNMTEVFDLEPGDTIPTIDAGFYQWAAVGDYIWIDEDRDGMQDASEPCVDSVLVFLYHCDDPEVALDSMYSINCRYLFDSLVPGDYFVKFINPDEETYGPTGAHAGNDDMDSDAEGEKLRTPCTNLSSGETDLSLDLGLVACPSLDSVSCIGDLQISIGQDGEIEINPGMILSINFACENLDVNILDSIGNDFGNIATCDMIGKELIVMVSEPSTGNSCWARLRIEDKIPPVVTCPDPLNLSCEDDPDPGVDQIRRFEISPGTILGPDAGTVTNIPIQVPDLGNLMVTGVNVYMDIDMDNPLDYVFPGGVTLTSPQGTVYDIYPFNLNPNCQLLFGMTGVDHGFDDGAATAFAVCQDFQSQNDFIPIGANIDNTFNGENEEGAWVWTITDQFDLQSGVVNRLVIELEMANSLELPRVFDNCDYDLEFVDINDTRNVCGIGQLTRLWTATDAGGNTSTCEQIISFTKQDNLTISWPPDYTVECFVDPTDLDPEDLPRPFDFPTYGSENCTQVAVSHVDQEFDICSPYSYTIRRTWTVLDWCDPNFEETQDQIIKVEDVIAPEIVCPDDLVLTLRHNDCFTNVSLPQVVATDNCDGNPVVTRELLDENDIVIPTIGVPVGEYRGRYIAEDACGNTDTCYISVSITDPVAPVAICFANLVVSLTSDGWAYVCADQIDNGSNDNCTDVGLQIRREDEDNWRFYDNMIRQNNCVRVACRDIGELEVILRVWDDADGNGSFGPIADTNGDNRIDENDITGDNYSECTTVLTIEDKLPPVLTCPPDVTISCLDDYQDLEITGEAEADGNCSNVDATYIDILPAHLCPGSTIRRQWSVEKRLEGHDGELNTPDDIVFNKTCEQLITLEDTTPIRIVKLPLDLTLSCSSNPSVAVQDLERYNYYDDYLNTPTIPEDDTLVVFDQPHVEYDCEHVAINYTDKEFVLCENSTKIKRLWTIIDWCDPNFSYIHEQIIFIDDDEAPVINVTVSTDGITESGLCEAWVNFQISAFDNCSPNVQIRHNSRYVTDLRDPSGYYPKGSHSINFTVIDGCGNVSTELVDFVVQDNRNPQASCKFGLAINLKPDGLAHMAAELLDAGSNDNCTDEENLNFYIQLLDANGDPAGPMLEEYVFDCGHLGANDVILIVEDADGNRSTCQTVILVEDNNDICSQTATFAGTITTEHGVEINLVETIINGQSMGMSNGSYSIADYPSSRENYIELYRNDDHRNGISTLDLIEIRKHILGLDSLDSAYEMLAADVDMSESIGVLDILYIRQIILREIQEFPDVNSWHFVPQSHIFQNAMNPWLTEIPYELVTSVGVDQLDANFIGYKMGDVNNSAEPSLNASSNRTDGSEKEMFTIEGEIDESKDIIRVNLGEQLAQFEGYQMALVFDDYYFVLEQIEGWSNADFNVNLIEEGVILVSKIDEGDSDENELSLIFRRVKGDIAFNLEIAEEWMIPEAYLVNGDKRSLELKLYNGNQMELLGNTPNPFGDESSINFVISEDDKVTLSVFNALGKLVYSKDKFLKKGYNSWLIDAQELGEAGLYYYQVEVGQHKLRSKFTLLK